MRRTFILGLTLLALTGCESYEGDDQTGNVPRLIQEERDYEAAFLETPITLLGRITSGGAPLTTARVSVQGREAVTDTDGEFRIEGLDRISSLVEVRADGHHDEVAVVWLHRPLDQTELDIGDLEVASRPTGQARMLFGGDVSLGRRFLNSDPPIDRVPTYDPDALISVDDAAATTRGVLQELRPLLQASDFVSVNLETVVTDEPLTPFDEKPYVFFTLPGSLDALQWWGVDYVALGNNHIYDYLEKGVIDTIFHLEERGIPHSGAGGSPGEAFEPYRTTVHGTAYSMVSIISFDGRQYPILWTADDTKGGAAYAWDNDRLTGTLEDERNAGRFPIVNIHTGSEYTELPSESARDRMLFAADAGAAMVIAHHPHVPQGFEWRDDVLLAHSLGNLAFDQERLETVMGLMAQVDLEGDRIDRVVGVPVYLEKFEPRPVAGEVADVFLRRIAWASAQYGAAAAVHRGKLWVAKPGETLPFTEETTTVTVDISSDGVGYLDLRPLADSAASVVRVDAGELNGALGRDILVFGGMEDVEVDDDQHETSKWYTTGGSSFPCLRNTHRGSVSLCSHRAFDDASSSVINFRNRVRTLGNATDSPNKEITVLAWMQGDNAGRTVLDVRYFAPLGSREFGEERAIDEVIGTRDWQPFWFDLSMPPESPDAPESRTRNPRALRLYLQHFGPDEGEGMLRLDDVAAVTWLRETDFEGQFSTETPHPFDFLRLEGAPGSYTVELTFRKWRPSQAGPF